MQDKFHRPDQAEADAIRGRLPDVPGVFSGTVSDDSIDPRKLKRPGMPRPKLRGVPIPATSLVSDDKVNIIQSRPEEWVGVIEHYQCDLCALPLLAEERAYCIAEEYDEYLIARGLMHRQCWVSAAHWCPHLREGLLDGSMVSGSCSVDDMTNPAQVQALIAGSETPPLAPHVIAEYRLALEAVVPEWPFKIVPAKAR